MCFFTTIQDFTTVYKEQTAFQQLLASKQNIYRMDCTAISGTDCYCDDEAQAEINQRKKQIIKQSNNETKPGLHFFDNGNYHYMSKLWTDDVQQDFDLIIFDHHPDMQPPRFEGILSCGGWVKEVFDHNVHIKNAILIGVADHLVEEIKNDPTAEFAKYLSQVHFIKESEIISMQEQKKPLNINNFGDFPRPVYISIDKDALCLKDAVTNWDQGSLTYNQLEQSLRDFFGSRKVLGVDICGERAINQDYAEGLDEGTADNTNSVINEKLFRLMEDLFARQKL